MLGFILSCAMFGGVGAEQAAVETPTTAGTLAYVELQALHYRLETYEAYRLQRPLYDHQIAVGRELLEIAQQIPETAPEQHVLAAWFEQATDITLLGQALPPTPQIDVTQYAGLVPARRTGGNRDSTSVPTTTTITSSTTTTTTTTPVTRVGTPASVNATPADTQTEGQVEDPAAERSPAPGFSFGSIGSIFRGVTGSSSRDATEDSSTVVTESASTESTESTESAELTGEDWTD
jgi:hypothetical protein